MTVPEAFGGLGMSELDFILMAEECGYVALPEPLVQNVMVGVSLLNDLGDEQKHLKEEWLPKVAGGEARLAVGHPANLLVADAHTATLLLLANGNEVHAVPRNQVNLTASESVDPSRKLFSVEWTPSAETPGRR